MTRCLPHTRQSLGYASTALCRVRAGLMCVLLDQRPSLSTFRQRSPGLVRMIHRYKYAIVRLLEDVRAGRVAIAFYRQPALLVPNRPPRGLPILGHEVSRRVWGLRLRRTGQGLALAVPGHVAFRQIHRVGVLIAIFRSSISSSPLPLFTHRRAPRGTQHKTRGRAGRYPFLVGLLHSLLHAGLSRRTDFHLQQRRLYQETPQLS